MKDRFLDTEGLVKKAGKLVKGLKETVGCIKRGEALLVVLAEDASGNTRKEAEYYCKAYQTALLATAYTKEELGRAAGESGMAVFSVTDKGLAELLTKAYRTKTGGTEI